MSYDRLSDTDTGSEALLESRVHNLRKSPLEWEEEPQTTWWSRAQRYLDRRQRCAWHQWMAHLLPCLTWLAQYDVRAWLLSDILAGLSVACMEIPQAMSYASLAGLPSVYGLYSAVVPCIAYCLFGTSRQLSVGPVSLTAMLLGAGLSDLFDGRVNDNPNQPQDPVLQHEYNKAAVQVAFLVGCIYLLVGLLRLGWVTNFLSHSVVSGYMSGACVVIALSQAKFILGLQLPRSGRVPDEVAAIVAHIGEANWRECVMGGSFIALLVLFKALAARHKRLALLRAIGPLTVMVASVAAMRVGKLYERPSTEHPYIAQLGHIPPGLPNLTINWWLPLRAPGAQLMLAALVCLLDALEAMTMAKSLAAKNGYEVHANRELRALAAANLAGAAFNGFNTTGSFSRSAVNNDVGAKTPLASGICGVLLLAVLLYLTPLFTHMSKNVQGAIIIVGVLGLLDWREGLLLYRVHRPDFVVWLVAMLATMLLGVVHGILVAVWLALAFVLYKSAFPRIVTLGRLPGTSPGLYRNTRMYPVTYEEPGMLLLRIDAPIYFANTTPVRDGVRKRVLRAKRQQRLRWVILNLSPVTDIDVSAIHMLEGLLEELKAAGIQLGLANPHQQVVALLRRSGLLDRIGPSNIHDNMHDLVARARAAIAEDAAAGAAAGMATAHASAAENGLLGGEVEGECFAGPAAAAAPAANGLRGDPGALR